MHNLEDVKASTVFPMGGENKAYEKYFIGKSYLNLLTMDRIVIGNVTFEPGCRNNWHMHHKGGQVLLCTAGRGYYQEWGKEPQELKAGDVVNIPPEVKHWEAYFSGEDDVTSDYLIEGLLRSIIHSAKIAVKNPNDYEARSNLMWSSTLAMNPIMGLSKTQDWEVHMIEHQLGAYTDCAHGMGLAAISLPYYRYIYKFGLDKFVRFATQVWDIDENGKTKEEVALEGIDAMEKFIKECGIVTNIKELGATEEMLTLIANSTVILGGYKVLTADEILEILKTAYAAK